MYFLQPTNKFLRKSKKLIKKQPDLKNKIENVFLCLAEEPFSSKLKTHKVNDIDGIPAYSSTLTKDLRIIWDFRYGKPQILDILDIGGHSGKNKVYQ